MRCGCCDPQRRLGNKKSCPLWRLYRRFAQWALSINDEWSLLGPCQAGHHAEGICMTGLSTFVNSARDIKRPVRLPRPSCSDPNPRQEGGCRIPSWTQILSILLGDHCRLGRWKWSLRPGVLGIFLATCDHLWPFCDHFVTGAPAAEPGSW